MRTPTLQYLYLQKPLFLILLIATISVLPWIGKGEFYTKGEPREASVAVSMIENGNWILPNVYADEVAYKPPFTHWMTAILSLMQGEVSPFTSRLPSAIAFILMIGFCFVFFGKRLKFQKAFITCLLLITAFEIHRAAMTSRVDMTLTALMVIAMIGLFKWEEASKLKGLQISPIILLNCAVLVKGPVGVILPLLVFGIYLLLLKYNFWKIIGKLFPVLLLSLVLPFIWYYLAYQEGGDDFIRIVFAENFGRFLGIENLNIHYDLGHEEPFWYNFITLLAGFIPWTLLLFFSLFGLNYTFKAPKLKTILTNLLSMSKVKLFSWVAAAVIVVFYCIPLSKRSVYLMPAYPFIAVFMAQYILYLTEYKRMVVRIFAGFLGGIISIIAILCILNLFGWIDLGGILSNFTHRERTLHDILVISKTLADPSFDYIALLLLLVFALCVLFYQLGKKINLKILYATFGMCLAFNLLLDGVVLPAFKNSWTSKYFVREIKEEFHLDKNNVFVMNDLKSYGNMYGPNFYLDNSFHNFEKELPSSGYLLAMSVDIPKIQDKYGNQYQFTFLKSSRNSYNDVRVVLELWKVEKKRQYENMKK